MSLEYFICSTSCLFDLLIALLFFKMQEPNSVFNQLRLVLVLLVNGSEHRNAFWFLGLTLLIELAMEIVERHGLQREVVRGEFSGLLFGHWRSLLIRKPLFIRVFGRDILRVGES